MGLSERTKKWLSKNSLQSLDGKTILVTGSNSGIGFKTAEVALYLGARIILACRNKEKAYAARTELLRDYPAGCIDVVELDLASFASIDAFVNKLKTDAVDIDVFVNNAGVFHQPGKTTSEGFELVIGTNYIGVYYLTERLIPYLTSLGHEVIYINTISMIHKIARVEYDDFYFKRNYRNLAAYARSKLCLAKYTYALAKRLNGSNMRIYMNHPGIAITPLGLNAYFEGGVPKAAKVFASIFNSPEKSSLSVSYILSHEIPAGSIVGPTRVFGGWGYPRKNHVYRKVKKGFEELIRFTECEIEKKSMKSNGNQRDYRK